MKMLSGSLSEIRFAWPQQPNEPLVEISRDLLALDEVAYINGNISITFCLLLQLDEKFGHHLIKSNLLT